MVVTVKVNGKIFNIALFMINLCCLMTASLGILTKFTGIVANNLGYYSIPPQPFLGLPLRFHNFLTKKFEKVTPFTVGLFLSIGITTVYN